MGTMKKIQPNDEFDLSGRVFTHNIDDEGQLKLKFIRYSSQKAKVGKSAFVPPTLHEVKAFFKVKGYTEESAIKFHEYYSNGEPPWTDGGGKPVRSWRQKCLSVWFRSENELPKKSDQEGKKFLF
jgi:hypothetical protein